MRKLITKIIATFCLASTCLGATTLIREPHSWAKYDLEVLSGQPITSNTQASHSNVTDVTLEKRRRIGVCEALIVGAACVTLKNEAVDIYNYLANVIKDLSHERSCGTFTDTIGPIKFKYRANGKHCDTTAEEGTIAGAIENHIERRGGQVCGMECLDLTHGGTWDGFLLVGPTGNFDSSMYCGPSLDFDQCTSGGKKDFGYTCSGGERMPGM